MIQIFSIFVKDFFIQKYFLLDFLVHKWDFLIKISLMLVGFDLTTTLVHTPHYGPVNMGCMGDDKHF